MNAQMLFIVCFSASLAAFGIALICVGLMLILKSEHRPAINFGHQNVERNGHRTEPLRQLDSCFPAGQRAAEPLIIVEDQNQLYVVRRDKTR